MYSVRNEKPLEDIENDSDDVSKNVSINVRKIITDSELKLLEEMLRKPAITVKELAKKMGVTERTIYREIQALKEKNVLVRHGSRKAGYWEIHQT